MSPEFINILKEIESPKFTAEFSVISNFSFLRKALMNDKRMSLLTDFLKDNDNIEFFINRISEISHTNIDLNYANPYDIAVSTYLLALNKINEKLSVFAANLVLDKFRKSWWSDKVSKYLLSNGVKPDGDQLFSYKFNVVPKSADIDDHVEETYTPKMYADFVTTVIKLPRFASKSDESDQSGTLEFNNISFTNTSNNDLIELTA